MFVDDEITIGFPFLIFHTFRTAAFQLFHDACEGAVIIRWSIRTAGNDQRSTSFIYQDVVHFVDDGEVQAAFLHHLLRRIHHIVPQIIETKFIVGAIGNIAVVCFLSADGFEELEAVIIGCVIGIETIRTGITTGAGILNHRCTQTQNVINRPHALQTYFAEIIVGRHQMRAFSGQGIQEQRQGSHEGLSLTGFHFRDFARMQDHPADQLDVIMTQADGSYGCLTHQGKCFHQQFIQGLTLFKPLFQTLRCGA